MSNVLYIRALSAQTIGVPTEVDFCVHAYDKYSSTVDTGYATEAELRKAWPSRLAALKRVLMTAEFADIAAVDDKGALELYECSAIVFEGFPEDGTLQTLEATAA